MAKIPESVKNLHHAEELYNFEQKDRKARKVVWSLIILIWTAGLLGIFGNGLLSTTQIERHYFKLEYDRFLR